jgi:hypothetical protein
MKRAAVAYVQSVENRLNKHKVLIEEIEKAIDDAIAEGKTYTYINKAMPYTVIEMLSSYGYTVRQTGSCHDINWDQS